MQDDYFESVTLDCMPCLGTPAMTFGVSIAVMFALLLLFLILSVLPLVVQIGLCHLSIVLKATYQKWKNRKEPRPSKEALDAGFGEADHSYFYSRVPTDGIDQPAVRAAASWLVDGVLDVEQIARGVGGGGEAQDPVKVTPPPPACRPRACGRV